MYSVEQGFSGEGKLQSSESLERNKMTLSSILGKNSLTPGIVFMSIPGLLEGRSPG